MLWCIVSHPSQHGPSPLLAPFAAQAVALDYCLPQLSNLPSSSTSGGGQVAPNNHQPRSDPRRICTSACTGTVAAVTSKWWWRRRGCGPSRRHLDLMPRRLPGAHRVNAVAITAPFSAQAVLSVAQFIAFSLAALRAPATRVSSSWLAAVQSVAAKACMVTVTVTARCCTHFSVSRCLICCWQTGAA